MNNTEIHRFGNDYYGWLWASTIGLGLIGLMFAHHYIGQVTANPQYSEIYLSDFQDWVNHGSLLFIVLFYFYFKSLRYGLNRQRHISTFIKLTIWSVVVVLVKIVIVGGLNYQVTSPLNAYMLASITHLDSLVTFGLFIFPITSLYMIGDFIRYKIKKIKINRAKPLQEHKVTNKGTVIFLFDNWWMIALIIIGLSAGVTTLGKWG